jgi:hypothetical protein
MGKGDQNTMGRVDKIPWIRCQNTMDREEVKIPWIGGQNTMGRVVDIPWVEGSKYHG